MGNQADNLNTSVEQLSEQVRNLRDRIEHLSARIATIEHLFPQQSQGRAPVKQPPPSGQAQARQELPPLINTSVLLTRIATVCFLLVIALMLRTITDNQIINTQAGSVLGMTYAAVLILAGWPLYGKQSTLAPIFPGCGILLLFSVVLETHAHYQSLSATGAYLILFAAGTVVFAMSIRYRATALVCLGVPGGSAVALAIDFPYPIYPVLGLLLLSAIVASSYAFKQQMCRYLRWFMLLLAGVFWLLWTSKVKTIPACAEPVAAAMYPGWFFPVLFLFWAVYLATVLLNVLKKDLRLGYFESIIPTVTAIGAFSAGNVAVSNWFQREDWFYTVIVIVATLHLGLAWWLARRDREKAAGSNVFILAGACLIMLTSAAVSRNNIGYVLPVWSASALVLGLLSVAWHNQGVRLTSYLMQAASCAAALLTGVFLLPYTLPAASGAAAGAICLFSLVHYRWSRNRPPETAHSFYFAKIDSKDRSAVILLIAGLAAGYYLCQLLLFQALAGVMAEFTNHLRSGQSLIINGGALVLMFLALKNRSREIILVAVAVALIGAGKVFILDLFSIKGVPLVLSVFSTGVVAASGSVVLGRWPKKEAEGP